MKRIVIPLAVLAIAASISGALLLWSQSSTAEDLELEGISAADVEKSGVRLLPPLGDDVAAVDEETAAEFARNNKLPPEARIREVVLARIQTLSIGEGLARDEQLVWVVNVDPDTVQWSGSIAYNGDPRDIGVGMLLIYVDAMTGEYLFSFERGDPLPDAAAAE